MVRALHKLKWNEEGAVLAEFALGFIPLIMVFALIFEFATMLWSHQAVVKGVRDATRYLSRVENPADAGAQAVAQNLLLTAQGLGGGTTRWSSGGGSPMQVNIAAYDSTAVGLRGPATIQVITVGANVQIPIPLSGVFTLFGGTPPTVWTYSVSDSARVYSQ